MVCSENWGKAGFFGEIVRKINLNLTGVDSQNFQKILGSKVFARFLQTYSYLRGYDSADAPESRAQLSGARF